MNELKIYLMAVLVLLMVVGFTVAIACVMLIVGMLLLSVALYSPFLGGLLLVVLVSLAIVYLADEVKKFDRKK